MNGMIKQVHLPPLNLLKMKKNYVLSLVAILICNVLAFGKQPIGDPEKNAVVSCFEVPSLTVLHPRCESPETGTITIDYPLGDNYLYSIDGINYQENPVFPFVLPGIYYVTYKDVSGCISEVNTVPVHDAMPFATIDLSEQSSLSQTVCMNSGISPIIYTIGGTATQAVVSGLPAGITTFFSEGVFTINGTPSTAGIYNFSITTDGGCPAALNGIIVVKLNAALGWVATSGARNQTLCYGNPIIPIKHIIANGATGAIADGLPSGITGVFSGGIYTVSGTPLVSGNYNFTITTTGGCSVASANGTIIVNDSPDVGLSCNLANSTPDSLAFDWTDAIGATGYNYSYTIGSGALVSGSVVTPSFNVTGVVAGQSVTFTITSIDNVACVVPQSVTCALQSLANERFDAAGFGYYPNPVHDKLTIDAISELKSLSVFNILGQKMLENHVSGRKAELDLTGFEKGIYLIYAISDNGTKTFRIVKE